MFAKNKDILAIQDTVDQLEYDASENHNELVETCNHNMDQVKKAFENNYAIIEDLRVDINEMQEQFDILCQHLGVSIEYQGEQRTYVITTVEEDCVVTATEENNNN